MHTVDQEILIISRLKWEKSTSQFIFSSRDEAPCASSNRKAWIESAVCSESERKNGLSTKQFVVLNFKIEN
jgi:hypothetical protein